MVTYVLETSAIVRYLDGEEGALRVEEIFILRRSRAALTVMSAIHWGELGGIIFQRSGRARMNNVLSRLLGMGLEIVDISPDQAVKAAVIKRLWKIPYADAFGVALTQEYPNCVLVTADFDFKPAEQMIAIEFLPQKA